MGFMDKAKARAEELAKQAQTKIDEVQGQFNEKQAASAGTGTGAPPPQYDKHGRPVSQAGDAPAAPPPASGPVPGAPVPGVDESPVPVSPQVADEPISPPAGDIRPAPVETATGGPAPDEPAPGPSPSGDLKPPSGEEGDYTPPKMSSGDPLG